MLEIIKLNTPEAVPLDCDPMDEITTATNIMGHLVFADRLVGLDAPVEEVKNRLAGDISRFVAKKMRIVKARRDYNRDVIETRGVSLVLDIDDLDGIIKAAYLAGLKRVPFDPVSRMRKNHAYINAIDEGIPE